MPTFQILYTHCLIVNHPAESPDGPATKGEVTGSSQMGMERSQTPSTTTAQHLSMDPFLGPGQDSVTTVANFNKTEVI